MEYPFARPKFFASEGIPYSILKISITIVVNLIE